MEVLNPSDLKSLHREIVGNELQPTFSYKAKSTKSESLLAQQDQAKIEALHSHVILVGPLADG